MTENQIRSAVSKVFEDSSIRVKDKVIDRLSEEILCNVPTDDSLAVTGIKYDGDNKTLTLDITGRIKPSAPRPKINAHFVVPKVRIRFI